MENNQSDTNLLSDQEVRKLVLARLSVLSSDTVISLGSEGSFNRDELVKKFRMAIKSERSWLKCRWNGYNLSKKA